MLTELPFGGFTFWRGVNYTITDRKYQDGLVEKLRLKTSL